MMKKQIFLLCFLLMGIVAGAQKMPVSYNFGEKFNDRYRYSNLMTIDGDGTGGYILVRAYYQGLILNSQAAF